VLASSAAEILALTTELASVSTETAASVNETISTVEEVKTDGDALNHRSPGVFPRPHSGRYRWPCRAMQPSTVPWKGINHIKGLMESVAESIVRLSEQTPGHKRDHHGCERSRSAIQSAGCKRRNRGIEGGRARERVCGRGSGNQEPGRSIQTGHRAGARYSQRYSEGHRRLRSCSGTGEQGSGRGRKAGRRSGDSISKLSESISESARAATQIAASSRQQLIGMDQIAIAMENIKTAAQQNVEGTKQAEQAAQNLNELGLKLKEMIGRYKG